MKNILVVDPVSTGQNYIEDIHHRGYHAVALIPKTNPDSASAMVREDALRNIVYPYDRIDEQPTYEETLELVRKSDPMIIVPGSEGGVVLANMLAADLGLKGNPRDHIDRMTKKNEMHSALKAAGVRHILGKVITSADEALEFCRQNNLKTAVIKPLESAGSMGVTLCNDLDEVAYAVETLLKEEDFYGRPITRCLIQERIVGTEYIVNTVSCGGKHRLTSVFKYVKVRTSEGGHIYSSIELIEKVEPGIRSLISYAFDTADAIGYQYGVIHGEYMIDEKGPVLIEVNCRPMGCSLPREFMDRCLGQHETDSVLDAYLDPEKFAADAEKPYHTNCGAALKLIMVPKAIEAETMPIWLIAKNLRSTYKVAVAADGMPIEFSKTVDLETSGGIIYMIHDDHDVLYHDLDLLNYIEKNYFGFLINDGTTRRLVPYKGEVKADPVKLMKQTGCHGSTLVIADEVCSIENGICITPSEIEDAGTGYSNVVICIEQYLMDHTESENLRLIFELIGKAKKGGRVIISESTCRYISYGDNGAELIFHILGIETVSPKAHDASNAVIGKI